MTPERDINCSTHFPSGEGAIGFSMDTARSRSIYPSYKAGFGGFLYRRDENRPATDHNVIIDEIVHQNPQNLLRNNILNNGGFMATRWINPEGTRLHHFHVDILSHYDPLSYDSLNEIFSGIDIEHIDEVVKGFVSEMPGVEIKSNSYLSFTLGGDVRLQLFREGDPFIVAEDGTNLNERLLLTDEGNYHYAQPRDLEEIFDAELSESLLESFPNINIKSGIKLQTLNFRVIQEKIEDGIKTGSLTEEQLREIVNPYTEIYLGS